MTYNKERHRRSEQNMTRIAADRARTHPAVMNSAVQLAGLISLACTSAGARTELKPIDLSSRIAIAESRIAGTRIELESIELARRVPGFGGLWFDRQGDLHAFLINLGDSVSLRPVMDTVVDRRMRYGNVRGRLVFDRGTYDFRELLMWRRSLSSGMRSFGGQSLGIAPSRNKVRVGVVDSSAIPVARDFARSAGIPDDALVVEKEDPLSAGPIRIEITPATPRIRVGATVQLSANSFGYRPDDPFTWRSIDDSIARVSEFGVVTGIARGEARITAARKGDPSAQGIVRVIVE